MKIALVYSFEGSDWFSCNVIVNNLKKSYGEIFNDKDMIHINYKRNQFVSKSDLEKLVSENIEKIIFIDHKPTPIYFLEQLKKIEAGNLSIKREYIIHVFGDFPLYLPEWREVFTLLDGCPVKLVCASKKQKKYIENFFTQKEIVFQSAFPVVASDFFFNPKNRVKIRKDYGYTDEDFIFLYTGRISYQKRVVDLIHSFYLALDKGSIAENSKLMIVGGFDNLGILYLGIEKELGEHFREVDVAIESRPEYKHLVNLVGKVKHEKLNDIYNSTDCYISLSTYHDEDYGMSVAEAIMTGLPAILTNWAGYNSFQIKDQEDKCQFVEVQLSQELPEIKSEDVNIAFKKIADLKFDRESFAKEVKTNFSIEAISTQLKDIINQDVPHFSDRTELMTFLTNEASFRGSRLFKSKVSSGFNELYYEVYKSYAE